MDSEALVRGQPFCAGALVFWRGRVVLTLEEAEGGGALCLRGVGGGQEAGETPWQTAVREAKEEIGAGIRVVAPGGTLWWDEDPRRWELVWDEAVPPALILGRKRLASPAPYKPGLPGGWHLHLVVYLAEAEAALVPGDEQVAVLLVPPERLASFEPGAEWRLGEIAGWGVEVRWRDAAPAGGGDGVQVTLPVWEEMVPVGAEALRRGLVPARLLGGGGGL